MNLSYFCLFVIIQLDSERMGLSVILRPNSDIFTYNLIFLNFWTHFWHYYAWVRFMTFLDLFLTFSGMHRKTSKMSDNRSKNVRKSIKYFEVTEKIWNWKTSDIFSIRIFKNSDILTRDSRWHPIVLEPFKWTSVIFVCYYTVRPWTNVIIAIKVWNINFFNFYEGGTEVLLHSKWWQDNSGFDPELNSFVLVVENMDIPAHPK